MITLVSIVLSLMGVGIVMAIITALNSFDKRLTKLED